MIGCLAGSTGSAAGSGSPACVRADRGTTQSVSDRSGGARTTILQWSAADVAGLVGALFTWLRRMLWMRQALAASAGGGRCPDGVLDRPWECSLRPVR